MAPSKNSKLVFINDKKITAILGAILACYFMFAGSESVPNQHIVTTKEIANTSPFAACGAHNCNANQGFSEEAKSLTTVSSADAVIRKFDESFENGDVLLAKETAPAIEALKRGDFSYVASYFDATTMCRDALANLDPDASEEAKCSAERLKQLDDQVAYLLKMGVNSANPDAEVGQSFFTLLEAGKILEELSGITQSADKQAIDAMKYNYSKKVNEVSELLNRVKIYNPRAAEFLTSLEESGALSPTNRPQFFSRGN